MKRKCKKIYTADELFDAIPGDAVVSGDTHEKINNIINVNEFKNTSSLDDVKFCDEQVRDRYICSEILDQGLMFIVNDGEKDFAKCMIVLPEYSNICGENIYLDSTKKYTYVLNNELNLKTMKRRVSARVIDTEQFESETGIDVSKYFKTKDNLELFADEISEHINLIKQCNTKETCRTVVLEIMKRAMHP